MKDFTDINVLLDRSGSMNIIKTDVIGGYNEFVATQKKAGDNASLTLIQFDEYNGVQISFSDTQHITDVADLTIDTYQPRGNTPLLDALGIAIRKTGERLEAIPIADRPDKVVFVVMTDGRENASTEFTKAAVKALTDQQEKVYNWQFVYLGANQDAFEEAGSVGIRIGRAANFVPQAASVRAGYAAASSNLANYRGTSDPADLDWNDEQREKMNDPDRLPK